MRSGLCLWIRALKARPSFQLPHTESRCVEDTERYLASDHPTERLTERSIWHVPVPPTGGDVSSQLQQLISGIVDIPGQQLPPASTFISYIQESTYIQSDFSIIWCPSREKDPPPFFSLNTWSTDRPSGIGDLGIYKLNLTRLEQWAFNQR